MKHTVRERDTGEAHWVGLDVFRTTVDAALARSDHVGCVP